MTLGQPDLCQDRQAARIPLTTYTKLVFLLPMIATEDLPIQNQRFTPYSDSKIILAYLNPILGQLSEFFAYACARAAQHFSDRGWAPDSNLFAYEVRKDVFERLKAQGADVTETEDVDATTFTLERIALSGLLLKLPGIQLRIRKSKDHEVPPAGSDQLLGFYNWNLFAFDEADNQNEDPASLHLVLLWNLSADSKISNFWLVCPRGERAGEVKWYWQEHVPATAVDTSNHGQEFRAAFKEANSDVPLSPKGKNAHMKQVTGTDKKTQ